jgi:hypothetical protein
MNWNKIYKTAGVSIWPRGYDQPKQNNTLLDICSAVANVLYTKYPNIGTKDVAPDGSSEFDGPTGVINFYVSFLTTKPGENPTMEQAKQFANDAKEALKSLGLEIDENEVINTYSDYQTLNPDIKSRHDQYNLNAQPRVVRINITKNYNVEHQELKEMFLEDEPPEFSCSYGTAQTLLNTILKFRNVNFQDSSFATVNAKDCAEAIDLYLQQQYVEPNIRTRLVLLKNLCDWCLSHHYTELDIA